ncbi:MAG: amino acid adenylation domain-containing protein, partial [Pseudomonadota bacterium]
MSSLYDRLAKLTPEQRRQFERRMAEQGMRTRRGLEPISPRASDRAPELSFAQSRLWFVQQLDPDNAAYNAGSALRLRGALDIGALTNALNAIIRRHEALRSCFVPTANGRPEVCVQDRVEVALPLEDFSRHGEAGDSRPEAGLREAVAALMRQPFDLRELPFRFALYRLSARDHVLVLIAHHIVCDRWSVMVFMRELLAHYQASLDGLECPVDPLPIQYGDWAIWQRERLRGQRLDDLLGYWRERLRGSPAYLELPTDRALPALASNRGAQYPVVLDRALGDALKALAGRNRVTLFTLLLAVFKVLLLRYSGSDDIVVGSEVANRDRTETAGLIGLLVNTLVLRSDLSGDPEFQTLLGRVHDTVVGALEHQELPFEQLVEAMNPARSLDQLTPLFQVKFDLQQVPVSSQGLGDLSIERFPVEEQQTKYQLRFNLQEGDDGIRGQIEYSTDLFDAATIERMAGHFQNLLTAVVADPTISIAKLSLLGAGERQWLIEGCNDNVIARPDGSIHGLFARQAALAPAQTAVIDGSRTLTYRQLDEASNRVASRLRALGVGPETPVGVCMPRDHRLVVALLGVLKAGGAYVPMDPDYPARRLAYMVADAGIEFLLAGAETPELGSPSRCRVLAVDSLLREGEAVPWRATMTPSQLAYVIYTSGSTGEPKGVAIEHRNAVAMLHWAKHQYDDASLSGVLAATSVCFDLSVFEVFAPLVHGGAVVIAENLLALHRHPARDQVTLVNTVPSLLRQILDGSGLPPNVRTVNLAGEPLPASLVRRLQALPQLRFIYNLYGPSEDTTYSTAAPLDRPHFGDGAERVPIGLPVENTHAIVLDAHHEPVPVGVSGELYLGGAGLARGYLHRETLTAERFVTNPLPEAVELGWTRLYRTGDRVVRRADGSLEFLGRVDHQFKLRGLRIEAGEIEATLRKHAAIREALVVAHR